MSEQKESLQDRVLEELRRSHAPVTVLYSPMRKKLSVAAPKASRLTKLPHRPMD